ncbi:MAG: hypothetical protein J5I62_04800 [Flavobacteriales bacterium]|nr:hypothetical protein [Flavobacteriales bacterium]MEB2341854.1 hypothetical protein [Flavobacteriia bacterium]
MRVFAIIAAAVLWPATGQAQKTPDFRPRAQGFLFLPVALDAPVFNGLTDVLGQVDASISFPLHKGLGIGAGANHTWYELNERALAPEWTIGSVNRLLLYGKLSWGRYTGPRSFYELNAKVGQAIWDWKCGTCPDSRRQADLGWGLNAAYFIHATDNLAFGISVGYHRDMSEFGPGVIGLDRFPGRTDTGGPYRFFNVGLGFSTGFQRSPQGEQGW